MTGPVELVLFISSSVRDTDFTAKLVDVHPSGRAEILTDGILRVRYRESFVDPELMEPAEIYEIKVDMQATGNVFKAGHRIRLEVSSSSFPRWTAIRTPATTSRQTARRMPRSRSTVSTTTVSIRHT